MSTVNVENMRAWVAALRSGDYPQTTGALERTKIGLSSQPVGFCCLGVACKLSGVESVKALGGVVSYDNYKNDLSVNVQKWLGLDSEDPVVTDPTLSMLTHLTELNDIYGRTFDQIADAIEYTYLNGVS